MWPIITWKEKGTLPIIFRDILSKDLLHVFLGERHHQAAHERLGVLLLELIRLGGQLRGRRCLGSGLGSLFTTRGREQEGC